ncbi:MAG TPA: hypothetical protein VFS58_16560 [Steroidobacteraceae bacterium]|nr:hypothetical protein [Steroidobacteraceae bacterium]
MPYLPQAAFWVGVIGTIAALPLVCVLRFQRSYMSEVAFQWSAPAVLFFMAAFAFVLVGWIPLGGGWLAGWLVAKLPDTPAQEAA